MGLHYLCTVSIAITLIHIFSIINTSDLDKTALISESLKDHILKGAIEWNKLFICGRSPHLQSY
jgi:hypothetical protein